jgi:myo-inositol-1(or 4)-monophosphatase
MSLSHDLQYAVELARGAGKIALEHYGKVERLTKTHAAASAEAVTDADRACQRHIVAGLKKRFAEDGIIGEENDSGDAITFDVTNLGGRTWVIDPIDGTNNFVSGLGLFCVCIGLLEAGNPVLGIVYDVTRDQLYCAAKGEGAWLGNKRIYAPPTPLSESSVIMMTSNVLDKQQRLPKWVPRWLSQTNWKVRILGSAALEAVQVSAGVAHGAVTVNGKLWDAAAPAAIVQESGGIFTSLTGEAIFPFNLAKYAGAKVPFLAAGAKAHPELLKEIRNNP